MTLRVVVGIWKIKLVVSESCIMIIGLMSSLPQGVLGSTSDISRAMEDNGLISAEELRLVFNRLDAQFSRQDCAKMIQIKRSKDVVKIKGSATETLFLQREEKVREETKNQSGNH